MATTQSLRTQNRRWALAHTAAGATMVTVQQAMCAMAGATGANRTLQAAPATRQVTPKAAAYMALAAERRTVRPPAPQATLLLLPAEAETPGGAVLPQRNPEPRYRLQRYGLNPAHIAREREMISAGRHQPALAGRAVAVIDSAAAPSIVEVKTMHREGVMRLAAIAGVRSNTLTVPALTAWLGNPLPVCDPNDVLPDNSNENQCPDSPFTVRDHCLLPVAVRVAFSARQTTPEERVGPQPKWECDTASNFVTEQRRFVTPALAGFIYGEAGARRSAGGRGSQTVARRDRRFAEDAMRVNANLFAPVRHGADERSACRPQGLSLLPGMISDTATWEGVWNELITGPVQRATHCAPSVEKRQNNGRENKRRNKQSNERGTNQKRTRGSAAIRRQK